MQLNSLTNQMVVDSKLKEEAIKMHQYFTEVLEQESSKPDTTKLKNLGFQNVGRAQFADQLDLTLKQAKQYQDISMAYPGYLVVHNKLMTAWILVNSLYISDYYQFTGSIPELNEQHILKFHNLLRLEHCTLQYKDNNKWNAFPPKMLTAAMPQILKAKGLNMHSPNGTRVKFGRTIQTGQRTFLSDANVRALPNYRMIADQKFFDKNAFLTDDAKNADYEKLPNPDPLVLLPIGDFNVVVTAWGHEEKLLPTLETLVRNNPIA